MSVLRVVVLDIHTQIFNTEKTTSTFLFAHLNLILILLIKIALTKTLTKRLKSFI